MKKLIFILSAFTFLRQLFLILLIMFSTYSMKSYGQISPLWQVSYNDSLPEDNFAVKSRIDYEDNIVILARGSNSSLGTGVDFILIKYNANGEKLWNRRFNGTGNSSDYPADMVIDKYNNIYVAGRSWGGSSTKNDYLTLKYNPAGELLWSRRFDWLVSRNDVAYAIALDSNENVYVTGYATAAFNGNELYDMVTVKYNTEGDQKWVRSFIGYGDASDWGYSINCDSKGNILVSGFTRSLMTGHDIISVKYDSIGNIIWEKRFYNHGDDFIRPLFSRIDANDNIIIASYYKGDSTLMDYLTFKYDSAGTLLWSRIYDGGIQLNDWVNDIKIDYKNNIIVTGSSPGLGTSYDFLTIKYSPEGNILWQNRFNDSTNTNDEGTIVAVDSKENVLVFGTVNSEYSVVCYYNQNGKLISNFRNHSMKNAASINIDKNDFPVIVGLRDPKTITAKYLDIITNVLSSNSSYPDKYILQQNYPNPFNPITNLEYGISNRGFVNLIVYNSLGKVINKLVNEDNIQGTYKVKFDGSNLPSGIYFYSLFIKNNLIETKRMILLK